MTAAPHALAPIHAPNAALLIDFDNVTMGIRSDLGRELRSLLSSDIIKGKVAVQRAYADWRRFPQYIVSLTESSIDLIFAPAYGASKKNATDIRLAIDALELVFTRPEIGTFILLSGDSDFSSLVIKLKEYGKYVIGVGIKESSSDLLIQNCDEYYSYNALAGLVKASDEEPVRKYDPWELVTEAVQRMKRNNDVMRSDRLKQVMQEIDNSFDEKNLGHAKFSKFCQEAAQRGLLSITKLDNGQLEVDLPSSSPATTTTSLRPEPTNGAAAEESAQASGEERSGRRGRRGRGGRGRDRDDREPRESRAPSVAVTGEHPADRPAQVELAIERQPEPVAAQPTGESVGESGQRLTRSEAFDIVKRAVEDLAPGDTSARASDVRRKARQLLGRDSESLSDRMFVRILKDAHDAGIVDLRRRGDDFEVARAVEAAPVSEQLARSDQAAAPPPPAAPTPTTTPRVGMGYRGARSGRPLGAPPPELLSFGVVDEPAPAPASAATPSANGANAAAAAGEEEGKAKRSRRGRGGRTGAKAAATPAESTPTPAVEKPVAEAGAKPEAKAKRGRAAKKGGGRGRKNAPAPAKS
jgi:uncharacterized protein (TIGR00288 family)